MVENAVPEWCSEGQTLGIALDVDTGSMLVKSGAASSWIPVFESGVMPGAEVGGGVFPVIFGLFGAKVRCNFGFDASRPLVLAPPTADFEAFGNAFAAQVELHGQPHRTTSFDWLSC